MTQQIVLQQTVTVKFCQNTVPIRIQQIFQSVLLGQLEFFNDLDVHHMLWKKLPFQLILQKIYFFFWQKSAASQINAQGISLSRCGNLRNCGIIQHALQICIQF